MEQRQKRTILLCTDGSESSRKAFDLSLREFVDKPDHYVVLHISDCKKTYLPDHFRPQHIIDEYNNLLLAMMHRTKYNIIVEEVDHSFDNPKQQIAYFASKLKADYLFMGSFGRKEVRIIALALQLSACLQFAKFRLSSYESITDLSKIKKDFQRRKNPSKGFNFVCCIDGSARSLKTFKHAMDLARNENDRIYALTSMADPLFTHEREAFEEIVKNYAEENGIVVEEHLFCEIEGFNNIGDSIENFVNFHEEIAFDYVLFGNCGLRAEQKGAYFVGRIADHLIKRSFVNPVVIP